MPQMMLSRVMRNSASQDINAGITHEERVREISDMLNKVANDNFASLAMVDMIQRLGIEYLFDKQIQVILERQHTLFVSCNCSEDDIYVVALQFRLLRQHGYYVSADVFECFKGREGGFDEMLKENIKGLMELYEASQMSVEGEDILDEVGYFSKRSLNDLLTRELDHDQAVTIASTLQYPYRKSFTRSLSPQGSLANNYMDLGIGNLLEVAKLERKLVCSIYNVEIQHINKWWNDLGLSKEMEFARDQPVKWYMWSMAVLPDPSLSELRVEFVKPISLVYIIDDIFDVYGTLDELILFTKTVQRWEIDTVELLPQCMKTCFKALDNITHEFGNTVFKKHGWNPTGTLKKMWSNLCDAFLVEYRWNASKKMPKVDEYLKNGIITSGVPLVLVHLLYLMGHHDTIDFENEEMPGIISSTATLLRLWDDLGCAQDENQSGHDGSYIECYLKENEGTSRQSARAHVMELISETWKRLNRECLSPSPFSTSFRTSCVNAAKMISLMYDFEDERGPRLLKQHMKSLLICDGITS